METTFFFAFTLLPAQNVLEKFLNCVELIHMGTCSHYMKLPTIKLFEPGKWSITPPFFVLFKPGCCEVCLNTVLFSGHFLQLGRLCPVHCSWSLCNSAFWRIREVKNSRHWTGQRSHGNHRWSCIPHWFNSQLPWRIILHLFSLWHSLSKIHSRIWISCAVYSNLYILYLMFLFYVTKGLRVIYCRRR